MISHKTAKLAKDVGYNGAAPTQDVLHKWVRENKNVLISVYRNASGFLWSMSTADGGTDLGYSDERGDCEHSGTFTTYEKAYEDALYLSLLGDVKKYRNGGNHYSGYVEYLTTLEKFI